MHVLERQMHSSSGLGKCQHANRDASKGKCLNAGLGSLQAHQGQQLSRACLQVGGQLLVLRTHMLQVHHQLVLVVVQLVPEEQEFGAFVLISGDHWAIDQRTRRWRWCIRLFWLCEC